MAYAATDWCPAQLVVPGACMISQVNLRPLTSCVESSAHLDGVGCDSVLLLDVSALHS